MMKLLKLIKLPNPFSYLFNLGLASSLLFFLSFLISPNSFLRNILDVYEVFGYAKNIKEN